MPNASGLRKQDLIFKILKERVKQNGLMFGRGRSKSSPTASASSAPRLQLPALPRRHLRLAEPDPPVRPQDRRHGVGPDPPAQGERALLRPAPGRGDQLRGPRQAREKVGFDDLTPLHPHERLKLETTGDEIVRPRRRPGHADRQGPARPDRGAAADRQDDPAPEDRTAIPTNHPDAYVIVLLIDERPEEVTDMERSVERRGRSASTFDEPASRHIQVAEMVIEKAKRMVEYGKDVVILLDSITRLARAYNTEVPPSGKILTGGIDSQRPPEAEAVLRRRPQDRGGRLADDPGDRAGRHRQPHGRRDLRGVQGHRQHGAPPRPPAGRQARLAGHRHQEERHPQRGAADARPRSSAASGSSAGSSTT